MRMAGWVAASTTPLRSVMAPRSGRSSLVFYIFSAAWAAKLWASRACS